MPAAPTLDLGPIPREEWRLSLRNTARDAGIFIQDANIGGGVSYQPLTQGTQNTAQFDYCDTPGIEFTQRDGSLTFLPWGIYAWEDCPVLGGSRGGAADLAARARDKLERQTSYLTEQTLWTGDISAAPAATDTLEELAASINPDGNNRRLASALATEIDGTGAHDIVVAFGLINEWVTQFVGAERVWIHVEPRLLPFLAFYQTAIRGLDANARVLNANLADHRIVAGSGYTGSAPGAGEVGDAESWIYVTTAVRFFQGPISAPDDPEQILNRSINRYRAVASRLVLAEWDLTLHGAIKVCLPGPGPAC